MKARAGEEADPSGKRRDEVEVVDPSTVKVPVILVLPQTSNLLEEVVAPSPKFPAEVTKSPLAPELICS